MLPLRTASIILLIVFCNIQQCPALIGGETTTPGEFPFMVAISLKGGGFCGSTLLNQLNILTSAHCIRGKNTTDLFIYMGLYNTTDPSKTTYREATKIQPHPNYSPTTKDYDLAIVTLNSPVNYSTTVQQVCISSLDGEKYVGTSATAIGWGYTTSGVEVYSEILRKVVVPVINNTVCQNAYKTAFNITLRMICAGPAQGGKDTCQGDSGGPLLAKEGTIWKQFAIISWGYKVCAQAGYYGVYTRISQVLPWIKSITTLKTC